MILSVNIGNTFINNAVFTDDDRILLKFSISSTPSKSSDEYRLLINSFLSEFEKKSAAKLTLEYAVISSVVPTLTSAVSAAISDIIGKRPFIIGSGTRTGCRIKIDNCSELGSDIVSDVAASMQIAKPPFVVVNAGTATTLTVVDKSGDIVGSIIPPGISVSAFALSNSAAKLFDVSISKPGKLIGQNSDESIRSGLIYGHSCMIDGLISKIKSEICDESDVLHVVFTGDYSDILAPYCSSFELIDSDLTLKGALMLFRLNVKKA